MARAKPNIDWLADARSALNADPAFRALGTADFKVAFHIGDVARMVEFCAFEVESVVEVDPADLRDADIVVTMPVKDWNAYLRSRKRGKAPTLLSLDLDSGWQIVQGANPLRRLKFERYNLSLQALIDKGAELAA